MILTYHIKISAKILPEMPSFPILLLIILSNEVKKHPLFVDIKYNLFCFKILKNLSL
jgi:hypothetical protein